MKHAVGAPFIQKTFSVLLAVTTFFVILSPVTEAYAPEKVTEIAIIPSNPLYERLAELADRVEKVIIDREETLWLARVVYSETKRPGEQFYIAWVVRNRVENEYGGDSTYKDVALAPGQFSGLHSRDRNYNLNISRTYDSTQPEWRSALAIAKQVYNSDIYDRPFSATVTHFFSPVAVATPAWARNKEPVLTIGSRFAFYKDVI